MKYECHPEEIGIGRAERTRGLTDPEVATPRLPAHQVSAAAAATTNAPTKWPERTDKYGDLPDATCDAGLTYYIQPQPVLLPQLEHV